MRLAFPARDQPTSAIDGTDERFPVERIFCVGRNYAAHAREMGGDPTREPPFFFTKFAHALVAGGGAVPYPASTTNFHYEAELVIAIGSDGADLDESSALAIVFGYACGLDMTRRDLQFAARDAGKPWDMGKNFAYAAPLGSIRPVAAGHVVDAAIRLAVNGVVKQDARTSELTWSCAEVLAHLSRYERLRPGDLVYTGTPAGVGPVVKGDVLDVTIDGLSPLSVTIT